MTWQTWLMVFLWVSTTVLIAYILWEIFRLKHRKIQEYYEKLQYLHRCEGSCYTEVKAQQEEFAKVRHDFNNHLATMHQLLATSKKSHAKKLLHELEESLSDVKQYLFCQNPIVDAILIVKKQECDAANIVLEAQVVIGENCGIASIHLCSIFANLLDNAIQASKLFAQRQAIIKLTTCYLGDYLYIKCVNPFVAYEKEKRKGYGKTILRNIANHYDGNFAVEVIDDTHVAVLSLCTVMEGSHHLKL